MTHPSDAMLNDYPLLESFRQCCQSFKLSFFLLGFVKLLERVPLLLCKPLSIIGIFLLGVSELLQEAAN